MTAIHQYDTLNRLYCTLIIRPNLTQAQRETIDWYYINRNIEALAAMVEHGHGR